MDKLRIDVFSHMVGFVIDFIHITIIFHIIVIVSHMGGIKIESDQNTDISITIFLGVTGMYSDLSIS